VRSLSVRADPANVTTEVTLFDFLANYDPAVGGQARSSLRPLESVLGVVPAVTSALGESVGTGSVVQVDHHGAFSPPTTGSVARRDAGRVVGGRVATAGWRLALAGGATARNGWRHDFSMGLLVRGANPPEFPKGRPGWSTPRPGSPLRRLARWGSILDKAACVEYAELAGDSNPVHRSGRAARAAGFPGIIAPGLLVAALAVAGGVIRLDSAGVVRAMTARFARPARAGSELTLAVWSTAAPETFRIAVEDERGPVLKHAAFTVTPSDAVTAQGTR
jgi:acyl dehydratase